MKYSCSVCKNVFYECDMVYDDYLGEWCCCNEACIKYFIETKRIELVKFDLPQDLKWTIWEAYKGWLETKDMKHIRTYKCTKCGCVEVIDYAYGLDLSNKDDMPNFKCGNYLGIVDGELVGYCNNTNWELIGEYTDHEWAEKEDEFLKKLEQENKN